MSTLLLQIGDDLLLQAADRLLIQITDGGGIVGEAAITEAGDTLSSASTIALAATLAATESSDTIASASALAIAATLAATEADDTLASAATIAIVANSATTEADDSLSSTSTIAIVATATITEADDTLASEATIADDERNAVLAITEADDAVTSTATIGLVAVVTITESDDTLTSTAGLAIVAVSAITEASDTLSSSSTIGLADPIWTINLSLTGRRTAACLAVTTARSTAFAWNRLLPAITATSSMTEASDTLTCTAIVAFNPLTDPDLVGLWVMLDASDNGTTITVPDRSPNSYTMTATGADRPAISTTGFCNQKGITSDQGTWKGISSSAIGASMVGNQQLSMIFLLGNVTDPGATRPFATYGTGYAGCFDVDVKYVTRGRLRANFIQAGGLTRCEMRTIADSEVLIAPKTVAVTFDGSLGSNQVIGYYQDGVLIPSSYETNGANATTFPDDSLALCNGFDGVFAGCAAVKRVLSQSEVLEFSNYLRDQYGMGTPKQVLWVGDSLVNATQLAAVQSQYATDRAATPALWGTYEAIDSSAAAGETIANIQTRLTTDLASGAYRQPTHILLHNCGTNDLLNGASAATIATRWEALLAHVYSLRPGVPIKLLSLIKNTASAGAFTQIVIDANALGPTAVANAIAANPGMVATWSNNAYEVTLLDGTHPTSPVGENEIAAVLWPIIKAW